MPLSWWVVIVGSFTLSFRTAGSIKTWRDKGEIDVHPQHSMKLGRWRALGGVSRSRSVQGLLNLTMELRFKLPSDILPETSSGQMRVVDSSTQKQHTS